METHFLVEARYEGAVRVLKLSGELDVASSGELERSVAEAGDYERLVMDLSDLEFIDSTGLSVLVAAQQRESEAGREFSVVQGSAQVQRLLALTGLDQRLTLADTLEQLLADASAGQEGITAQGPSGPHPPIDDHSTQ